MRKSNFVKLLLIMMVFALIITGCSKETAQTTEGGPKKAIELKMNVTTSESSVWMVAAEEFKRIVEEETEGRYKVSIFPNEQLSSGDLQKGVEMLFTGITDLDIHSVINMTGFEPKFTVCSMPFIFPNGYDDIDKYIMSGSGKEMLFELVRGKGAEPLGIGENGFRQVTNNKRAIKTPEDLKSLKLRTPPIAMYIDLFKLLGADPTSMSFSEVFTALQQGTIDGQENPLDTIRSGQIHEVQKYMTIWNYSYDPIIVSCSNKVWKSLSDEDKEIFKKAGEEAGKLQVKASREKDAEILASFKEKMEVTELTPEEIGKFRDLVGPIYEQYRDIITDDVFKAFGYEF